MPTYLGANSEININDDSNLSFIATISKAWYSGVAAIHLSDRATLSWSKTANEINLVTNAYQSSSTVWKLIAAGAASRIQIVDTAMTFFHADSGLADNTITWQQDMKIENDGFITIGESGLGSRIKMNIAQSADVGYVGAVIYHTVNSANNLTTGESTLLSKVIKLRTLADPGHSFSFEAHGVTANNANVKTLRVKFGATTVASRTMTPSTANSWCIRGTVYMLTTTTQRVVVTFFDGSAVETDVANPSGDNTNTDLFFDITAQGGATNDIIMYGSKIWWEDRFT